MSGTTPDESRHGAGAGGRHGAPAPAARAAAAGAATGSKGRASTGSKAHAATGSKGGSGGTPRGWRRFFGWKRLLLVSGAFVLLMFAAFGVAYALIGVPSPNELANAQASILYYADGKTELDRISEVNRESVDIDKVPKEVQQAVLAAEDRGFYENQGVSLTGIARAAWNTARGGDVQGGSTITQQYVKNYFLTQDRTLSRKAREFFISLKIDRQQTKDQILANYLNTIYYGRGSYGIQTASKAYFDKDVSELDVAEGALLATVIRAPGLYDPALGQRQEANARSRFVYVLDGMVQQGWLTAQERAGVTFPNTVTRKANRAARGSTGYITAAVRKELMTKLNLTDADIDASGLRITTTIERRAQNAAVRAVQNNMPTGSGTKGLQVGLAAVKPGDGAIVAMYGGEDYSKIQFNSATDATMQAGSTFKVFTLLAALQREISTKTRFDGGSPQSFPEFAGGDNGTGRVSNFGGQSFGEIDLRTATANSVNTVYAQLNIRVTPQATMDAAVLAGIPKETLGLSANHANVFGTASPRVIDMANAYATIASGGGRATPYLIKKVSAVNGEVDYTAEKKIVPAFDKDVTRDAIDAMEQVVKQGTATRAQRLGRPAAGKTGTTTENRAVWFDGFTPQLAAAVGMYKDVNGTPEPLRNIAGFGELTGGTFPVQIWTAFMEGALRGQKVLNFPGRVGLGDNQVKLPTTTVTETTRTETATETRTGTSGTRTQTATKTQEPTEEPTRTRTRTRTRDVGQNPDDDTTADQTGG